MRLCFFTLYLLISIQYTLSQEKYYLISDTLTSESITKKTFEIDEIHVTNKKQDANLKSGSTGLIIDVKQLKQLPKFVGESDPFKAIKYLGGVSQAGEANSGLYVRGGNNDQNLILLNGTIIQNPSHVLGLFSVFNPDLIEQMRFVKSGIPAEYGGKLSSVVDINTINSIPEKIEIKGSIGLISSRISTQIPLGSKFSLYASWRGSYISTTVLPFIKNNNDSTLDNKKYEFWDSNAGFIYNLSPTTKITCHFYSGKDYFKIGEVKKTTFQGNNTFWKNTTAALKLNHFYNEKWSMSQQLSYSQFQIQSRIEWFNSKPTIKSQLKIVSFKSDYVHIVENRHHIKFGAELNYNESTPNFLSSDSILPIEITQEHNIIHTTLLSLYARDELSIDKWLFNIGLRSNLYAHIGPYTDFGDIQNRSYKQNSFIKTYSGIEPRFFSRYLINSKSSLKISATHHQQFLNQIPVFSIGVPIDLQIPASLYVKPQSSWHFSTGYFRNFNENNWEFSLEIYYKTLKNQLEFNDDMIDAFSNGSYEKGLISGKGWTYGSEWKISKNIGKFTGWISYNLAWNYRQFKDVNNGMTFLSRNDRRHDISIIGMFKLNDKWSFSSVFVYATGSRLNLPLSWFVIDNKYILEYGKYNNFVMPAYHRLDISANYKLKPFRGINSELDFSIYNVYNRSNPFQVYFNATSQKIRMNYLLPIIPSISWTFKF